MSPEEIVRVLSTHRPIVTHGQSRCNSLECDGVIFENMVGVFRHQAKIITGGEE